MNRRSGIESTKRILDAAMRKFSEHGYAKTSMRMIAKASGISIGGLYIYFKNKEDLYLTLIKSRLDDLVARSRETLKDIKDPAEAIKTFISLHLTYAKKHRELILIQGREHGFSFGIEMKRRFFRSQRNLIEDIIKKGIRDGIFRKCNVKEAAKIITSAIRGFVLSIVIESEALFSPEECSNLILHGLLWRNNR